ncbi:DUF6695 family protein [Aureibaculum luteum]
MGLIGTLIPPNLPKTIPENSKWLSGQGTGCWFSMETTTISNTYRIVRYTPQGIVDCDRIFKLVENDSVFEIGQPYEFVHVSHCNKCRIQQNNQLFIFNYHINIDSL